jgi:transposase
VHNSLAFCQDSAVLLPMAHTLTSQEINQRMIEWRNLKKLHTKDQEIKKQLRAENKELKQEVGQLQELVVTLFTKIEKLELRQEELLTKVFGKKSQKRIPRESQVTKQSRSKDSYHRSLPTEEEITHKEHHSIDTCPGCRGSLAKKREKTFFVEDITLSKKSVIKKVVEVGYCKNCTKWHGAIETPPTKVVIGDTVRTHVAYMSTVMRLSYAQIIDDLSNRFSFNISSGEIAKILNKKAERHQEHYTQLKEMIRTSPVVHVDETGDRVREGDGYKAYTWLMQAPKQPEVVFTMGKTRGKGVAEELLGTSTAVGVTDDYGAYTNLFDAHHLCMAHLHRKLRDLAESSILEGETLKNCKQAFVHESEIYARVRMLANRDDLTEHQRRLWIAKLTKELLVLATTHSHDPEKLKTYKTTLLKNIPKYLTGVRLPNVPCHNNQAERSLRHVVLKRKTSFGHVTQRGAETMSILMSIFMTIRNRIKETNQTFFEAYADFSV